MIELILLEYLKASLDIPVVMEVPKDKPAEYVLIEKTGSGRNNTIDMATVAIQSCSDISLYRAAVLNERVKALMNEIVALGSISMARLNTDYNFTNRETKTYRYQAVYDLVYFN